MNRTWNELDSMIAQVIVWVQAYCCEGNADPMERWTKADQADWATSVDVGLERGVRSLLEAMTPEIAVQGEEMGRSGPEDATLVWHLDPVDGTTNLVHHIPASAFSLGLVNARHEPVLGLVMNLFTGDVFYGRDHIVWWNHQPMRLTPAPEVTGEVVFTELEGFRAWPELGSLATWLEDHYGTLRILGSSALALAETAVGHGAAVVLSRFDTCDVAGGLALCRAAGLSWADRQGFRAAIPENGLMVGSHAVVKQLWNVAWSRTQTNSAWSQG